MSCYPSWMILFIIVSELSAPWAAPHNCYLLKTHTGGEQSVRLTVCANHRNPEHNSTSCSIMLILSYFFCCTFKHGGYISCAIKSTAR
jgi:hypothetical protein